MAGRGELSKKSATILSLMAQGKSYAQIVDSTIDVSYMDIFEAAKEALRLLEPRSEAPRAEAPSPIVLLRQQYPRAYELWDEGDDLDLRSLYEQRRSIEDIAQILQRQPSAIESRVRKLGIGPNRSGR